MKTISIVIPVFNEEGNVRRAYETVTELMKGLADRYHYEILFTDNHSTDATFEILQEIASADPNVRAVRFSRNFGYQKSIFAAFALSSGDAVVQLDCDLQDPPELIPEFIAKWEEGNKVVYGVRRSRKEGLFINLVRRIFYRLITWASDDDLPTDAGDFRLVDRSLVRELVKFWDYNPYLRGTIAWMGYQQAGVPYDRSARVAGESKFTFGKLVSLAVDGILAHTVLPLRLATYTGITAGFLAFLAGAGYVVGRFAFGQEWPAGFATLAVISIASFSMNALFLGIVGEYLSRMYMQSKGRPLVLIESSVNFDESPGSIRVGDDR